MNSPPRSHATRWPHPLALLFALVGFVYEAPSASAAAAHHGRWTPAENLSKIAVHMSLLPSPDSASYHSKIVLWNHGGEHHDPDEFDGTVWNWSPTVQDACSSWPSSNFSAQTLTAPTFDIFCAVSQPTQAGDLWVVGGTEFGEAGTRETAVFRASDNTWVSSGSMQYGRWYGGLAALPDGRSVVSSGSLYDMLWVYGGKTAAGSTIGDLNRFGANLNGVWEAAVPKSSGWPEERSGQAATGELTIFGGRNASGTMKNDVWDMTTSDNETGSDYTYTWTERWDLSSDPPPARHRTAAVTDTSGNLWVIGGIGRNIANTAATVFNDVWSVRKDAQGKWDWSSHTPSGGPGARYGHTAVFDKPRNRILLFGGAADSAAATTDSTVYALNLGTSPTWSTPTLRGATAPSPRLGHAMIYDKFDRVRTVDPDSAEYHAVLFGGQSQEGTGFSNQVWHLWIARDGELEWKLPSPTGTAPTARAWATGARNGSRFIFFGGETDSGAAGGQAYEFEVVEPNDGWDATNGTWRTLAARSGGLSGASMIAYTNRPIFPRYAEIATPGDANSWQTLTGPLLHEWYPGMWTWPTQSGGGYKVFFAGPSFQTGSPLRWTSYQLDVSSGSWREFPSGGNSGIKGGASVLYRPGKIMKCGTRDTEGKGVTAITTTKIIDLLGDTTWTSSDAMKWGRVNHNLTLLPTGEVLATGGTGSVSNQEILNPRREPEIWNPDPNSGTGDWYRGPDDSLAMSPLVKDYHSTAILLPDGRVITAGGNADDLSEVRASIYCPPYLFKANGDLAPRPVISSAPTAVAWGKTFTVCVSDTVGITRVALVAPGATTHGQDQGQRYIPLTFTKSPYGQKLYVTAPSDSNVAPPGYYMLFLTGAKESSTLYPDVPSIAKWIRVKRALRDTCDATRPRIMTDFYVETIGQTTADLYWTEHADDSTSSASGRIQQFELRKSLSPITDWFAATEIYGEPAPAGPGTAQGYEATALSCNTWYYFGSRSLDDNQNLSLLYSISFKTLSAGCGSLMADGGAGSSRMSASATGPAPQASSSRLGSRTAGTADVEGETTAGPLVVETSLLEDGTWSVQTARLADGNGIPASENGQILVQVRDDADEWQTVNRVNPPAVGEPLGLCSMRERGRFVLPAGYSIEQAATQLRGKGGEVAAQSVTHSDLGTLETSALADPAVTDLAAGESFTTVYAAAEPGGEESASWHLLVRRVSESPQISQGGGGSSALLPTRFGLSQNAPNPFAASTRIEFQLPRESRVKLEIFDLLGRRVRTLTEAWWPAGRHAIAWDRMTDDGVRLSSGVFVYRMTADGFRDQKRMVLISR